MQDLERAQIAELLRENNRLLKKLAGEEQIDIKKEVMELPVELKDKIITEVIASKSLEEVLEFHEKEIEPKLRQEKEKREMNRYKEDY